MNYSIQMQTDRIMVESWASSRRRAWGAAIAILLLAPGGSVLYLRYARDFAMSLSVSTAAASLIGYGLARVATDFWLRERVALSATSARRAATLFGLPLTNGAHEFSRMPAVSAVEKGIEIPGASFRFGRYLSHEDAAAIATEINQFLSVDG